MRTRTLPSLRARELERGVVIPDAWIIEEQAPVLEDRREQPCLELPIPAAPEAPAPTERAPSTVVIIDL